MPNLLFRCWMDPIHLEQEQELQRHKTYVGRVSVSMPWLPLGHYTPNQSPINADFLKKQTCFPCSSQSGGVWDENGHPPQPSRHHDGHPVTHSLCFCHVMCGQEGAPLCVCEGGLDGLPISSKEEFQCMEILQLFWIF